MLLIHTALFAEAKPIIEYLKLKFIQKKPYRVYRDKDTILVITGMNKKTLELREIIQHYPIKRAINIGIAGCKDRNVAIGSLFCTYKKGNDGFSLVSSGLKPPIPFGSLSCVDKPLDNPKELTTLLVDMESQYFLKATKNIDEVYVFKVVSDYLDTAIPNKRFVWKIIGDNLAKIGYYFDHAKE